MKQGSIAFQVNQTLRGLQEFGNSKHSAKEEFKAGYGGSKQIDKFMADFGKSSGIYSYQTYKDYLAVSISAARFAQEKFNVKDISKLEAAHIKAFLQDKAANGAAKATIQKYSAALEKFGSALSLKFEKVYTFDVKSALSDRAKDNLATKERSGFIGYSKPNALINHIQTMNVRNEFKIAARIQLESGVRGLKDLNNIKITGDKAISITKGGKSRELNLSKGLIADLKDYLSGKNLNTFKVNYKGYLSVLKSAAISTNQKYQASHGLRHNFFERRAAELQRQGMDIKESWKAVSEEMGHGRIVYNYIR